MRIDYAAESDTCTQPMSSLCQQIIIEGDKYSTKRRCMIEQCSIIPCVGAVFICRQHIYIAQAQSNRDRTRHAVIHV